MIDECTQLLGFVNNTDEDSRAGESHRASIWGVVGRKYPCQHGDIPSTLDQQRGMAGQYPFAVLGGKAIDNYGPWICSLAASVFFSVGFGLFSFDVARAQGASEPSMATFIRLSLYFLY